VVPYLACEGIDAEHAQDLPPLLEVECEVPIELVALNNVGACRPSGELTRGRHRK